MVNDEGTFYPIHVTLGFTSPEMLNIPMPTDWHVMPSDWDDYTLDIKVLKHNQIIMSIHMDSLKIAVSCGLPYLRAGAVPDKTNRETCQSSIHRVMGYLVGTPHFKISYKHLSLSLSVYKRSTKRRELRKGWLISSRTGKCTVTSWHRHTLNYETGSMLCVMQVLQMIDLQGNVNKYT
jgi:hypothetical protein